MKEYHIAQFGPTSVWPEGGWSLFEITGAQIAERTIWEHKDGKYQIAERWPWPGFVGCFSTLEAVFEEIRTPSRSR